MSVAAQLGLDDEHDGLLLLAGRRWGGWVARNPGLIGVGSVAALRGWLVEAEPAEADQVLRALAQLGSPGGGGDVAAAATLAWALLPGACALAYRLRTLSTRIDEIVAAQLWIEVRTFPWQRLNRVAANILSNTRAGVLRDCSAASQLQRTDRTWSSTRPVDPAGPFCVGYAARRQASASAAEELLNVLEWACETGVITDTDRCLLLCLVEAADRSATKRTGRGSAGLMANDVSEAVASRWGMSPVTVRRRARRTLTALTTARAQLAIAA